MAGHWKLQNWTTEHYKQYQVRLKVIHQAAVSHTGLTDSNFLRFCVAQMKNVTTPEERRQKLSTINEEQLKATLDKQKPEFIQYRFVKADSMLDRVQVVTMSPKDIKERVKANERAKKTMGMLTRAV